MGLLVIGFSVQKLMLKITLKNLYAFKCAKGERIPFLMDKIRIGVTEASKLMDTD